MDTNGNAPLLTPEQIERILDGKKLPTKTVPVCMRLDLVETYEGLEQQLHAALVANTDRPKGSASLEEARPEDDPAVLAIAARMDALRDEMLAATIGFQLEAVGDGRWQDVLLQHPPRRDEAGNAVLLDARLGFNQDSFWKALIPESVVWPKLPESRWQKLLSKTREALTPGQISELADAIWVLNRESTKVPFSRLASTLHRRPPAE